METIRIDVYLPATGSNYELRIPRRMNCLLAAHLAADAIAELSEGSYRSSRSSLFAWRDSGKLLGMNHSLAQEHVQNGSRLMLI